MDLPQEGFGRTIQLMTFLTGMEIRVHDMPNPYLCDISSIYQYFSKPSFKGDGAKKRNVQKNKLTNIGRCDSYTIKWLNNRTARLLVLI